MKNILITGGMGFVGSNLAIKYVHEGYNVKIYDNLDKYSGANKFNINLIKNDIEFIKGDILDFAFLKKNLTNVDTVINCAASTSHSKSMKDPVGNLDVNIKGVINILETFYTLEFLISFSCFLVFFLCLKLSYL